MKISTNTIIRTIVLVIALANQILTATGKNPLPFAEEEIYETVSTVATLIASVWAWWKNNSFTQKAIKADEYKKSL
jgi:SPP1 family holin